MNIVVRTFLLCAAFAVCGSAVTASTSAPAPARAQQESAGWRPWQVGLLGGGVGIASIATTYLIMRALHAWKSKQEQARLRAAYQVSQVETEHERDSLQEKNRKLEETIVHLSNIVSRTGKGDMLADRIVRAAGKRPAPVPFTGGEEQSSVLLADDHLHRVSHDVKGK